MIIRHVKKEDNSILAAVIREAFEEYKAPKCGTVYSDPTTDDLYALFQKERSVLWVAEVDDKVVGCCGIYPTVGLPQGYAELVKFYLNKNARGRGVGKALFERSARSAMELRYEQLYLESLPQFADAISMYEKQGFMAIDHPLGQSGHTSCNVWMVKRLDGPGLR